MTNQLYPSVDTHESSWADIGIDFNIPGLGLSLSLFEIVGIKGTATVEVGELRKASGGRVMSRTAGDEKLEASGEFTRAGHEMLLVGLAAAATARGQVRGNRVIVSGIPFDVNIQHTPLGKVGIYEIKFSGCRFLSDGFDFKSGTDADIIPITLNPIEIARKLPNGQWAVLR